MSTDNFKVALVHEICPICGKAMNEQIIMNTKLTNKTAKEIENINGKAIGYSKNACEECIKLRNKIKEDVIFCIATDIEKSDKNNPYRAGEVVGVRADNKLFQDYPNFILKTDNDIKYYFMDEKLGIKLGIFNN